MILGHDAILAAVASGKVVIDPFEPKHVGPNSVDLTLGDSLYCVHLDNDLSHVDWGAVFSRYLDPAQRKQVEGISGVPTKAQPDRNGTPCFYLQPGVLYLGHTVEVAGSEVYVPCIEGRSSLARLGVQVHISAGFGDVGFMNQWTLEITTMVPVKLYPGMRIAQVYFYEVTGAGKQYAGKYRARTQGPQPSQIWRDFEKETKR